MLRAALFDMDGLLIDSEPFWQASEIEVFAQYGLHLTPDDCRRTMGRRVDEVVRYWQGSHPPLAQAATATVAEAIVAGVAHRIRTQGQLLPGVPEAIALCQQLGLRLAVASSSYLRLIETVVDHFELRNAFAVLHSAEFEAEGKPHPAVFLHAAERLGAAPADCVVFEDSPNGVRAALAAGMRCIAVPDAGVRHDAVFRQAHVVLSSLRMLEAGHLAAS